MLNEELKKFKLLSEYSFYTEEPNDEEDLILGSGLGEADEAPLDPNVAEPEDDSKTAGNTDTTPGTDPVVDPTMGADATAPVEDPNMAPDPNANPVGDEAPEIQPEPELEMQPEAPTDEVEVDVTELVQGSEEATNAANDANQKTSELLSKFSDLERRVASMGNITHKIDALEKEIVKRNPTPIEKLEMRSMDSYPYNIKLTDYWNDVDGYDPTSENNSEPKKQEYVLTKDDIDSGFTDSSIKQTFDVPADYEEEDI